MRIATSIILTCLFTSTHSVRTETSEDAPLLQVMEDTSWIFGETRRRRQHLVWDMSGLTEAQRNAHLAPEDRTYYSYPSVEWDRTYHDGPTTTTIPVRAPNPPPNPPPGAQRRIRNQPNKARLLENKLEESEAAPVHFEEGLLESKDELVVPDFRLEESEAAPVHFEEELLENKDELVVPDFRLEESEAAPVHFEEALHENKDELVVPDFRLEESEAAPVHFEEELFKNKDELVVPDFRLEESEAAPVHFEEGLLENKGELVAPAALTPRTHLSPRLAELAENQDLALTHKQKQRLLEMLSESQLASVGQISFPTTLQ